MEYILKKVKIAVAVFLILFCLWLIITGQPNVGYPGLIQMLIGYVGILTVLFLYNRPYSK